MKYLNTSINKTMMFGISCIVLLSAQAWATDYYVSLSGGDANPGTLLQPWRTIGKAASTLISGDTVYVQEGTYPEVVTVGASGADASHYITYQAVGTVNVQRWIIANKKYIIIDGFHSIDSYNPPRYGFLVSVAGTSSYVTVKNMTLTMPNPGTSAPCTNEAGLIQTDRLSSHITVTGNTLSRNCWFPAVQTGGSYQTYSNNTIFDTFTDSFQGEGLNNSTISGNIIGPFFVVGMHNDCFQLFSDNGYPNNEITIENNICHDGDQPGNMSLDAQSSSGIYIRNNIFYNFTGQFGLGIPNTKVYNNVFFRTATITNFTALGSYGWGTTVMGIEVKNNFFIGIGSPTYNYDYGTGYTVTAANAGASNNYYAKDPTAASPWGSVGFAMGTEPNSVNGGNPLFTSYSTYNFNLQYSSPAINKGVTIPSFSIDKNGISRPQGAAWDIGPFETIITPPSAPTNIRIQ